MNIAALRNVVGAWGAIETIRVDDPDPTFLSMVEIRCGTDQALVVEVDIGDDSVVLSHRPASATAGELVDVSGALPWKELVGGQLLWVWMLTNHLGYQDGVQFAVRTNGRQRVLQLLAVASSLKPYEVSSPSVSRWQSA